MRAANVLAWSTLGVIGLDFALILYGKSQHGDARDAVFVKVIMFAFAVIVLGVATFITGLAGRRRGTSGAMPIIVGAIAGIGSLIIGVGGLIFALVVAGGMGND